MTILCECNASIHDSLFNQSEDWVSNPRTTNMGSRRNPIYILDDDMRDVGRKDISLGIITENIDMMGSNTSQLLGKRICEERESDRTDVCC